MHEIGIFGTILHSREGGRCQLLCFAAHCIFDFSSGLFFVYDVTGEKQSMISFCKKNLQHLVGFFATVDFFSPSDPPPASNPSKLAPPKKYEGSSKLIRFFVERNLFFQPFLVSVSSSRVRTADRGYTSLANTF